AFGVASRRTCCVTASPVISSKAALISARCRSCWDTPTSRRRRSTRICRPPRSGGCTRSFTRGHDDGKASARLSASRARRRRIGALAAERGMRAYLVGGVVRDLWRDAPFHAGDLDVVVEGDAPVLADAVATALGGTLRVHERFLTASVTTRTVGRIDVITSRS